MTTVNNRGVRWAASLGWLSLLLASLPLASCGKTNGPGSGETHFLVRCESTCGSGYDCLCGTCTLSCDDDSACHSAWVGATCAPVDGCAMTTGVCGVECSADADCAELGGDFECNAGACRQRPPSSVPQCDSGCFPVVGYPEDEQRQCADLTLGEEVACQCGEPAANGSCFTRAADGTHWILPDGEFQDEGAWEYCSSEVRQAISASCNFASCENRPNSFCSAEDTCAGRACDTLQYFDDGCARTNCEQNGDDDCAAAERCVTVPSIDVSQCTYSAEGGCNCGGPTIDLSGNYCNPTAAVGPRGEWQELNVVDDNGLCIPDACRYEWHVTPDGNVAMRKQGVDSSATLSAEDLDELSALIDGPELRRDLVDTSCVSEDQDTTYELVLPDESLQQIVTGCRDGEPEGNVYARVWTILQRY